jgi:DNA-binding NarL/FixJ family response regulator
VSGGTNYIFSKLSNSTAPVAVRNEKVEQMGLLKREIELLVLIANGFTNAGIADKLFTSKRTIDTPPEHTRKIRSQEHGQSYIGVGYAVSFKNSQL